MPLVEYRGRKLFYELHGPPLSANGATPLLLLQGTGGTSRGWLPLQVPEFSKTRPVLITDYRGTGESDHDGEPFSTADLADDAIGLLDAIGIARADVLGSFMGGMAAQEMALRHPARVRRLVLSGSYSRPDAKRRMLLEDWVALIDAKVPFETMVRSRIIWSLQDETLEQTDLIEGMIEFLTKEEPTVPPEVFRQQCLACIEHDTADRLHEIPHPTLVICGRNDQLTPRRLHRELADEIPNARLLTTHYGGHLVMVEAAERFNESVLQFLDEDG
jgi:aminoacrylate hydrolase